MRELTTKILGPWAVRQTSRSESIGDYLTLTGSSAPFNLATANSYSTGFSGSSGTSVVNITGTYSIGDTSAYAVKFVNTSGTLNGILTLVSGGMILNGGTLCGSGAVRFFDPESPTAKTGMVFAGSSTASTIATPLSTTMGMVKLRAYWMKAVMSPILCQFWVIPMPPTTEIST